MVISFNSLFDYSYNNTIFK